MTSYVVDGEALSEVLSLIYIDSPAETEVIGKEWLIEKIINNVAGFGFLFKILDSIGDHSMKTIIKELDNK